MLTRSISKPGASRYANDESGSVALAILVLMLGAALAATSLSQSRHALHTTREADDRTAALAGAERGLAEASALLRNGQTPPFNGNGSLQSGTYSYDVAFTAGVATVRAVSTVRGGTRAVEADIRQTLTSSLQPQPTVFADSRLTTGSGFGSILGKVATNGEIDFSGTVPGTVQQVFSPNGFCDGCPSLIESPGPALYPDVPVPAGPTRPCDTYQWFDGVVDGGHGSPFDCGDGAYLIFYEGMQIINPPLIVFTGYRDVYIWDADVNKGGDPSNFQIYVSTTHEYSARAFLRDSDVAVQFYAPGLSATASNYRANGRHIFNDLTIDAGAGVYLRNTSPDEIVETESWAMTSWRVVPNP